MNRKQITLIVIASLLFVGAGAVLALNLKTNPSLSNSSSSDDDSDYGAIDNKEKVGTEYQTTSGAPSTKSIGSSTQTQSNTPSKTPNTNNQTTATVPNTYTPPVTSPCPDYLRDSYTGTYDANINAENVTYQNNRDSIKSYWNSRGLLYSGATEGALATEDQRHQTALSVINNNYQQQLAKSNCS
jgi:hypothetical protein